MGQLIGQGPTVEANGRPCVDCIVWELRGKTCHGTTHHGKTPHGATAAIARQDMSLDYGAYTPQQDRIRHDTTQHGDRANT